ncbi:MAG: hypothetical protein ACREAD_01775 [Nitrosopumilaceae archaeon]
MKRGYKILIIGGSMEAFFLIGLAITNVVSPCPFGRFCERIIATNLDTFFSYLLFSMLYGGVVALLAGAVIFILDRRQNRLNSKTI